MNKRSNKGFTLVELLVIVTVLGVLMGVLLVIINPETQFKKARDTGRRASLKTVQAALEQYYNDNGAYPPTACWSGDACWTLGAGSFLGSNATNYIKTLPTDPKQVGANCTLSAAYGFQYKPSGSGNTSYVLATRFENLKDVYVQTGGLAGCYWSAPNGFNFSLSNQQ